MVIKYNMAAIQNASGGVTNCADRMREIGETLFTELKQILGDRFTGATASALEQCHLDWDRKCGEFITAEQAFAERVAQAAENMDLTDRAGAARFY